MSSSDGLSVIKYSKRCKLIRPNSRTGWPATWESCDSSRILVLFLPWLKAKEKNVSKYTSLYTDLGMDVLCVRTHGIDMIWPPRMLKEVAKLIKVLQNRSEDYDKIFIHTMSIGGYTLTSLLMLLYKDASNTNLLDKMCGIIHDSVVVGAGEGGMFQAEEGETTRLKPQKPIDIFATGIARSVTRRKLLLAVIKKVSKAYLTVTKSKTLNFYVEAYGVIKDNPPNIPTLLLASKDDPVSDYKVLFRLVDHWKKDGLVPQVKVQMWEKSGHAQHLMHHREDYLTLQHIFMTGVFS